MIPNYYPPADDENISFWVNNISKLNFMSVKEFCETYIADRNFLEYGKGKDWIRNIDQAYSEFEQYLPDAIDIMRHKTMYYTMLPFMSLRSQAVFAEYIFRSRPSPVIPDQLLPRVSNFYICPLCVKEDLAIHKRVIVHTPHMLPNVTCCHKHGVRLIPFKSLKSEVHPIAASASEIKTAVFMYCLYNSPLFIDWDVTKEAVKDELKKQGISYTDFLNAHAELFKEEKLSISSMLQMFQKVQDEHFYMVRTVSVWL